jgi:hypothetical protein
MRALEAVLGSLSFFSQLRPDEIGRVARRFETVTLAPREKRAFDGTLAGARLVVAFILHYGLEKRLFALVKGGADPNPMHVHHFNYGLVLIGLAGLAALFPLGRRALRVLAVLFGIGCGLVFDEFALFWNLNPEYAQSLSLITAAIAAAVLVQLTYFRRFWSALGRTLVSLARGAR